MISFASSLVKAAAVASLVSAPVSAEANTFFEDDADFLSAPSAEIGVTSSTTTTSEETQTSFEECSVPGVCRTYKVADGSFTAVITNLVTGKAINIPMGATFEAPVFHEKDGVLVPGVAYSVTANVGDWGNFCYPETKELTFVPEDDNVEITIDIPCE